MTTFIAQEKDEDAILGREDKTAATLAPLPSSFVRASAAPQPKASYWALLKQELRREERWSWLPVPPRRHLINFKGQDHDQPSRGFILFRVGVLLYWSCWLAVSVVGSAKGIHLPPPLYEYLGYGVLWLIYATNWMATLLWVHLVLACLAMVVAMRTSDSGLNGHRESKVASCVGVASWIVRDTVAPAAVMVTLLYWMLLFSIFRYTTFVDVHLHLISAIIILADLWLSHLPYWLLHFPAPMAYLCTYILFASIYYAAGGKAPKEKDYIYPWLDFGRLGVTIPIIFLVLFVIFPLVHGSLWAFERKARQQVMARQANEARQRAEARQADTQTEAQTEEGVVEAWKTEGRGRGREELKQEKWDEAEEGEQHTLAFYSMDSSEDGEGRHGLFWDAAATPEGLLGDSRWGRGRRDTRKHDTNLPLYPSHNAPGTPRSGSWSSWTPWKRIPKRDNTEKQRAWQRRPYVRSVTSDELQHLREDLLGEAVEEAEFEEAVDEAECEEEQWVSFHDAEQMSV